MPYDQRLAERIRSALADHPHITEKKMFGGVAFLRRGLMFVGVSNDALLARVGMEDYTASLARKYVRPMDFTGRPMRGYVFVDPAGTKTEAQLRFWLERCERFVATLPPKAEK